MAYTTAGTDGHVSHRNPGILILPSPISFQLSVLPSVLHLAKAVPQKSSEASNHGLLVLDIGPLQIQSGIQHILTIHFRRAIDTVILKTTQKAEVISDIETYIDPSTQAWYGARGIPYRRGYLFHGEPGTGKTSLAMAIAGRFGLDIYVISLLDMSIGDSELIGLFNTLPPKCLLLLEDIDTVGLQRESPGSRQNGPKWAKQLTKIGDDEEDDEEEKPQRSRVSLSGLLNAIDGVAAPEGHILIMTTNKPEKLDEALVRSGRISVRVAFEKATREQARDIFMRMYWHEEERSETYRSEPAVEATAEEHAGLQALAQQFSELIPDHLFSPADLQDFLLMRRKDPQRAIDELEEWKATTMEERAKKAEDEAKRRRDRAEKTKREMAEMIAMSGEIQGAVQQGSVLPEAFPEAKEKVREASEESTATTLVQEAARV
jgi:SpoVK/Ycf46/Vps4 family AAA+-type ATPase